MLTGFIYGITLFLSILFVKIRDLSNVMELFFQLLFWASAVFYNLDDMQGNTGAVIRLNPLAIIIDAARKAFIHGEIAHTEYMFGLTLVVVLLIGVGTWFFNRNIKRIAEFF